jgi:hypothetical protein
VEANSTGVQGSRRAVAPSDDDDDDDDDSLGQTSTVVWLFKENQQITASYFLGDPTKPFELSSDEVTHRHATSFPYFLIKSPVRCQQLTALYRNQASRQQEF